MRPTYIKHIVKHGDVEKTTATHVMRYDGKSYVKVYYFGDDKQTGYFSNLSVDKKVRKRGEGSKLLKLVESMLRKKKFKFACLWVQNKSWVKKWYERIGYEFYATNSKEKNSVWMRKKL